MPITATKFRSLCLALPDATEAPHFDRAAFRTPQRIFATMAPDKKSANLMLSVDEQAAMTSASTAFAALDNAWGRKGVTMVTFADVDETHLQDALDWAHARAMVKTKSSRPKLKKAKRRAKSK
jgi:hypothetical protein